MFIKNQLKLNPFFKYKNILSKKKKLQILYKILNDVNRTKARVKMKTRVTIETTTLQIV